MRGEDLGRGPTLGALPFSKFLESTLAASRRGHLGDELRQPLIDIPKSRVRRDKETFKPVVAARLGGRVKAELA